MISSGLQVGLNPVAGVLIRKDRRRLETEKTRKTM